MHKLIIRQIKRFLGDTSNLPEEWQKFLNAVSDTYTHYDEDHTLLERSIEISSKELTEINQKLRQEIETVRNSKAQNQELGRMNKFMIGRELKMVELKKEIDELKEENERLKKEHEPASNG